LCSTYWTQLDWIYCTLYSIFTQFGTTGNRALSLMYTVYSSPLHTRLDSQSSLVVSWQLIYHSLTNFKSRVMPSFHSLTPFLPLFCSCQFRRLDSIKFLCSQAHIPAGWRLETRLFTSYYYSVFLKRAYLSLYNPRHGPCWKHYLLLLRRRVY
jgi:hypothetical protein